VAGWHRGAAAAARAAATAGPLRAAAAVGARAYSAAATVVAARGGCSNASGIRRVVDGQHSLSAAHHYAYPRSRRFSSEAGTDKDKKELTEEEQAAAGLRGTESAEERAAHERDSEARKSANPPDADSLKPSDAPPVVQLPAEPKQPVAEPGGAPIPLPAQTGPVLQLAPDTALHTTESTQAAAAALPEHAEPAPSGGEPKVHQSSPAIHEPTPAEKAEAEAAEAARAKAHAEVDAAVFAPIPTTRPDTELEALRMEAAAKARAAEEAAEAVTEAEGEHDPSASLPKVSSSAGFIRGTLWFDNMYPMRVHWLDLRYLVSTNNHDQIIPKLFARAFSLSGFTLLSATPRANEGGVYVHFEVEKTAKIRTPEDVTAALITLLRAKPVHAALTPKAVRCHLVRGKPFLDDMTSRFPYNRLKVEIRGPNSALADLTLEQLYNEFSAFGRIVDLTLGPFEKDKSRLATVQFVRMFSAVGARNCLHRLRLTVPLLVGTLPAAVAPDDEAARAKAKAPPPTADAILFLSYESLLKTSYVTDFFVKHPRIMVPLLGLLFAFTTYLIFDPLRTFNIQNQITHRLDLSVLYSRLPWPFGWIRQQAAQLGQSRMMQALRRGAGMDAADGMGGSGASSASTWSAREADEEKVRKWLQSSPDRILFLTGPKGAGKQALIKKLTAGRRNVVFLDVSHMLDRNDDEFVKALANAVGFAPGFALLTWISNLMDVFTPGASKAAGSSSATSTQILKILECTSHALVAIATKENKRRAKEQRQRQQEKSERKRRELQERMERGERVDPAEVVAVTRALQQGTEVADPNASAPAPVDKEVAEKAVGKLSTAAAAMDSERSKREAAQKAEPANKAAAGKPADSSSPAARAVGSVLGLAGGAAPGGAVGSQAAASASAAATAAANKPASSGSSSGGQAASASSAPDASRAPGAQPSNTFEPLSHAPVGPALPEHVSTSSAPLRLQERRPSLEREDSYHLEDSQATEQQRNFVIFKRRQAQEREEHAARQKQAASAESAEAGADGAVAVAPSSTSSSAKGPKTPVPDALPLFVIDGFNSDNASKHGNFLNVLAAWSAEMSAAGVARFVFLTDAGLEESVSKALPDAHLAEVVLSDASPEAAQEFLYASLPPKMRASVPRGDPATLSALRILGGRYTDLQALARGIENNSHPVEVVEDIVVQAMSTVKSLLFNEDKQCKWSKVQMWQVMHLLTASPHGSLLYDDLLFNVFSGDDTPLKALVRSDLLRVEPALSRGGDRVRAGSPVFLEAFKRLVHHQHKLRPGMDLLVLKYQTGVETGKIAAAEEELIKIAQAEAAALAEAPVQAAQHAYAQGGAHWDWSRGHLERVDRSLPRSSAPSTGVSGGSLSDLRTRQAFLLRLVADSQTKIAGYDEKRRDCEKKIKDIKKTEE